jgi:shikimate dehydrogenase
MKITFPTKIYGLLGYPITHSLSPPMHNAALKALSINAKYELFSLKPEELDEFLKPSSLKSRHIFGFNVTMPYKEKIISYINGPLSYEARLSQAVNTVRIKEKILEGFNTDGLGFHRHLTQELGFDYSSKRIALIGAGGAAKAISISLVKAPADIRLPKSITIYDKNLIKAREWVDVLSKESPSCVIKLAESIEELDIKRCDLLINATPVGMKKEDPCLVTADMLHSNLLVYDLIYNPPETKLLKLAKEKGASYSNGLKMLLYQGALSFELWTQLKPPLKVMWQALCNKVESRE